MYLHNSPCDKQKAKLSYWRKLLLLSNLADVVKLSPCVAFVRIKLWGSCLHFSVLCQRLSNQPASVFYLKPRGSWKEPLGLYGSGSPSSGQQLLMLHTGRALSYREAVLCFTLTVHIDADSVEIFHFLTGCNGPGSRNEKNNIISWRENF